MEQDNLLDLELTRLREKVEQSVGRKMKTPKDFDFLAEQIFNKLHEQLSSTTLKRVWGYLTETSVPRKSTLDILAQFVDYEDWEHFCQADQQGSVQLFPENKTSYLRFYAVFLTALVVVVTALFAYPNITMFSESEKVLRVGDKFSSPHDYLAIFGITAKDSLWGQVVPGHPQISIWGPQYHHEAWHNEGNKDLMMPTITEYWEPADADSSLVAQRNFDQFKHYSRLNEVRITFMKDLVDSNYVYLGVYRLSLSQSDVTKCVWERVARNCDLEHLDMLDELAN